MHFNYRTSLLLIVLSLTCQVVLSLNSCSIEKNGMVVDLSQADNGQSGWQVSDYIPGSYYILNPCKPIIPTNTSCSVNQGSYQMVFIDNYFHRCLGIGKPGPKISLFDPSNIANGIVVDFEYFASSNGELLGAQLNFVCDEKVEFNAHYHGKSKKFLKEEYIYMFKIITKYACPKRMNQVKKTIPIIRGN